MTSIARNGIKGPELASEEARSGEREAEAAGPGAGERRPGAPGGRKGGGLAGEATDREDDGEPEAGGEGEGDPGAEAGAGEAARGGGRGREGRRTGQGYEPDETGAGTGGGDAETGGSASGEDRGDDQGVTTEGAADTNARPERKTEGMTPATRGEADAGREREPQKPTRDTSTTPNRRANTASRQSGG